MSFPNRLTPDQIDDLDRNISRDEIKAAVWDCGENKSPGPDGFTFEFFRHFWDLIGSDLCAAVNCFFDSGSFPRGCNSSFIALIPKVMDAKFVTDFRPISLIGSVYKVVTKILANRLSMVISDLISNTQSAFVKNRQILDGPFILNEALAWCKRKKKQALMFKVDFAKAYDSVRWDFLLDALHAFGFGSRWCSWIRGIFSSNMASILVNGSPTSEFLISCGLKQGDPLAPLLFILVMETLHISVSRAVHDGVFKGLQIHDSMVLSYLFYVDDVVFVGAWPDDKDPSMFSASLGLEDKYAKESSAGRVTVGDHMSRHSAWSIIIQKIRSRFSMWKAKTLSIGGRLTLLKSVLGAVPLYTMSIYKAPKGVLHEMEMIRNKFFIGADSTIRKINWVAWDKVLASKIHRGLGVSSYYALNRALLLKWVWRFISQDGSLWSRVISAIYGSSIESHAPNFSSCWNSILREVHTLASKGFNFLSHWTKAVSVAVKRGASSLNVSFRRQVRDGVESHQWSELNSLLGSFIFSPSSDRWSCDLNGEGMFRVKDIRSVLDDLFLPSSNEATRWVKYVPIKVNVFAWRARLDRLPTRDNLAKRGAIMDSSLCPICGLFPEKAQHLFFGCELARSIALRICHWWNLNWTEISSFAEWNSWSIFDDSPPKRSLLFDDIVSFSFNWYKSSSLDTCLFFYSHPPVPLDLRSEANFNRLDKCYITITFTLSNFDKPLSIDLDVFSTVIGLKRNENFVSVPPKETMRAGLATLGLTDEKNTSIPSSELVNLSLLKMRYFSPKWRVLMQYILGDAYLNENLKTFKPHHITILSFKPKFENEVPLTAHMCKVANLSPEPIKYLIHSSEDVNTDDTTDKSLSGTTVQSVTQSKAPIDKKTKRKRIPTSSKPEASKIVRESPSKEQTTNSQPAEEPMVTTDITQSLGASELAEEQGNQPKTAEA
ncbi:RNA-directed DNA polymerase, eukaryota [Tanacetum coccineum]